MQTKTAENRTGQLAAQLDNVSSESPQPTMIKQMSFPDAQGVQGRVGLLPSFDLDGYHGLEDLLPYDGVRKVVHRSSNAKTGYFVARTSEDGGVPRVVGQESGLERSVALKAMLHPNFYGLKCQPRTVEFNDPVGKVKSNTLDFLLTLRSGEKIYLYVKNEDSLSRPRHALICQQVRLALPEGYGFAAVSEAKFPAHVRGNQERMFLAKRSTDMEADHRLAWVLADNINTPCFTVEELVFRCGMGPKNRDLGRAFDAVLRFVADQKLRLKQSEMIDYPTVLEHAA